MFNIPMGVKAVDKWSFGHFMMGVLSGYLFRISSFTNVNNFLITNGIHAFIELIEKKSYKGVLLESCVNHVSDIVFFFIGWVFSFALKNIQGTNVIVLLWIVLLSVFLKEIYREIFPYSNGFIKGAFFKKMCKTDIS